MRATAFGERFKRWRARRHVSQLQLAIDTGVSPRHLSFIETGRATPSREMILKLAGRLGVPLDEQNQLLLSAGHAPEFALAPMPAADFEQLLTVASTILAQHPQVPCVVTDGARNVVRANEAASILLALASPAGRTPPVNLYRLLLHPDGLAPFIEDFERFSSQLVARLDHEVQATSRAELRSIFAEVSKYPRIGQRSHQAEPAAPLRLIIDGQRWAFISTVAVLGLPTDLNQVELVMETLFPADQATQQLLAQALAPHAVRMVR